MVNYSIFISVINGLQRMHNRLPQLYNRISFAKLQLAQSICTGLNELVRELLLRFHERGEQLYIANKSINCE